MYSTVCRFLWYFLFGFCVVTNVQAKVAQTTPTALLGQKLMLDFRYFCDDGTPSLQCKTPVTELTPEVADILVSGQIGGVILFKENLVSAAQIVTLNYAMQKLMQKHGLPPLFIAIDQEGGRVARLDDSIATRFVGNMAIGATYEKSGTAFASAVGEGIAKSLRPLGFNVNFAPTVDVNVNPQNPVINVRSYGESAERVAKLGKASVAAMQSWNIMSALKHFPGHGDTHVDSHTGLPRVTHDRAAVDKIDLLPFKEIIHSDSPPAMIMTAHIQYPQLDSTTFLAKDGKTTVLPATMSEKILTGLLREELNYKGVIVTDALDMAGIAHYFDNAAAVIQTFKAGADIALMPYTIRNIKDIEGFWQMHQDVLEAIRDGRLAKAQLEQSVARILALKNQYSTDAFTKLPLTQRIAQTKPLPLAENKRLERQLARQAITQLYDTGVLPVARQQRWQTVMPDEARCQAFKTGINHADTLAKVECISLATIPEGSPWKGWRKGDVVVIGDISPQHSVAEMGGMDDLPNLATRASKQQQYEWMLRAVAYAKQNGLPVIFVALRAPYVVEQFADLADAAVTTYGYNVTVRGASATGAVFDALADALLGIAPMHGQLPVTVNLPAIHD
ncbi:glycoside hydrolase family 3 protein [Alteromonas pelagimontana]|uniref:beta-N-acetylhexosaminidase n=1 Tax=Alteromonas pelagimontana TaxID=1858656 RepID=A0A6M4MCV5_9ALTE|nr:glycoside hydrolase family 3 protein [Alteromonas pelagimontana]QJR80480.1 glycoside hydrolase family 3 protein [Alteromonas pelagimontana]